MAGKDPKEIVIDEKKGNKAVDLLYEGMIFWHGEGQRIIKQLQVMLERNGDTRILTKLAITWKDIDDRWIDIASKLAPYQSAKLSSIEKREIVEKRYVITVPERNNNTKAWMERVEKEQAMLPKPTVITQVVNTQDDTIDEIEYGEINDEARH